MLLKLGHAIRSRRSAVLLAITMTVLPTALAQAMPADNDQAAMSSQSATQTSGVAQGITPIRSRLAQIQAVLDQNPRGGSLKAGIRPVTLAMDDGMGASPPAMPAKVMPAAAGCCASMMGKMGAAGSMPAATPSELPGFPGTSHLYHVGATGFFLDYSIALKLTANQQGALNQIKERSIGEMATALRGIDQAEQELYVLTAANEPDEAQIQSKVHEIEKLRSNARMSFIRAVGEAVGVLTHDQHRAVLGTMTSDQK